MKRLKISRSSARYAGRHLRTDDGFTLAEVVVALALFTVVAVASVSLIVKLVQSGNVTQDRVAASNLAREQVDLIHVRNNVPNQLPTSATTIALTTALGASPAPTVTYTVSAALPACPTATTAPKLRNYSVTVTWNGGGVRQVKYDSALAC